LSHITDDLMLLADDDELTLTFMRGFAHRLGFQALEARDGAEALQLMQEKVSIALIDLQMPRMGGMELVAELNARFPRTEILIVSGEGGVADAVAAMKLGVADYLQKPVDFSTLSAAIDRARYRSRLRAENIRLKGFAPPEAGASASPTVQNICAKWRNDLLRIAPLEGTVLLTGETGTGKSLAARFIHENGRRASKPIVSVNCASLPRDLIECELFGHKRGSFTGAVEDRAGRAELASEGTLFLDEIGDLPLELQPKLLTFLQDKTAYRVGSNTPYTVDCRVIAATHRDLRSLCREKLFREDLFYRLDVLRVELPALRDRTQEIPTIVSSIVGRLAARYDKPHSVSDEFLNAVQKHSWPGNIRELENVIERAIAFSDGTVLTAEHMRLSSSFEERTAADATDKSATSLAGRTMDEIEKMALLQTLNYVHGNKARAARELGISEKSIYNKLKRFGIDY
jgi:DNA-binding NtrC family response regulator